MKSLLRRLAKLDAAIRARRRGPASKVFAVWVQPHPKPENWDTAGARVIIRLQGEPSDPLSAINAHKD